MGVNGNNKGSVSVPEGAGGAEKTGPESLLFSRKGHGKRHKNASSQENWGTMKENRKSHLKSALKEGFPALKILGVRRMR